ncbi:MAG: Rieske 2Fe-2S domain-containing protein [Chloroflexota bacterium]
MMVTSIKANSSNTAPAPSRREFLNYAFGASIALALAGSCGGLVWFMQQQISFAEGSGYFRIDLSTLPRVGDVPVKVEDARAFLANLDGELVAFSSVCTSRGCLVRWSVSNGRFECPCCGSKFERDGTYIEGPAKRSLDRCELRMMTSHDTLITPDDGAPLPFADAQSIVLNTNRIILGAPRPVRPPR